MTPVNPATLYRLPAAAEILGLPVETVRALVHSKRLASIEIHKGGHRRVKGSVLLAFGAPDRKQRPAVHDLDKIIRERNREFFRRTTHTETVPVA